MNLSLHITGHTPADLERALRETLARLGSGATRAAHEGATFSYEFAVTGTPIAKYGYWPPGPGGLLPDTHSDYDTACAHRLPQHLIMGLDAKGAIIEAIA